MYIYIYIFFKCLHLFQKKKIEINKLQLQINQGYSFMAYMFACIIMCFPLSMNFNTDCTQS